MASIEVPPAYGGTVVEVPTCMRSVLVLALLLVSSFAYAQAPGMTPPIEPKRQVVDERDPSIAVLLSLGVPVAGAITMAAAKSDGVTLLGFGAFYFGPSTGQWYAGQVGGLGLGLRAAAGVSMVYGFVRVLQTEDDCDEYDGPCAAERQRADRSGQIGAGFMIAGAGLWLGSSIYDIVLAKRAADSWNARHTVMLTPGLVGTTGSKTPGVFLSAKF